MEQEAQSDEINDSPIEEVKLTVPITDDAALPTLTFRVWLLGPSTCIFLAFLTQFTNYRQVNVPLSSASFVLLFLPIGKLMAATLPTKLIRIPGTMWTFSLNPGPFNIKEHVLLVTFAASGLSDSFADTIVLIAKAFYHKKVKFWGSLMLVQTSQMMGYGFAGIFLKFLVDSPYMWWPYALADVPFYRVMHEVEGKRSKGQLTKLQFFIIVSVSSFAYNIIPTYFFPSIIALSFVCWIWKDSVTAQQIGSGLHGFGIGSFALDWPSVSSYAGGNPLIMPIYAVINIMVGFVLLAYIIAPATYWTNLDGAKRFPIFSNDILDDKGQAYNVSTIVDDDLTLNVEAYNKNPMYFSVFFVISIGFQLAAEAAIVTYFILYHARETWQQFKESFRKGGKKFVDVHNKLMKKYDPIPQWWFYAIIVSMMALALSNSMSTFGKQFQLPYWGVLLGYFLPFIFILPLGILNATTGQGSINMLSLSQLVMGWLYPGNPLRSLAFQSYSTATLTTSLAFLQQFKLAHYLKIPPKSMFICQILGVLISNTANLGFLWWLLTTVENICDKKKLPEGSPWTCPYVHLTFSKSMIWGGVGPTRMFARHSLLYSKIYYFFLIGVIVTVLVWILSRMFPKKKWIRLINVPLILASATGMPPVGAVHYWSFFTVAVIFAVVYRKYKRWWARYNYLLSNGLDMGVGLIALVASLSLNIQDIYGLKWWGLEVGDHCPLASCPTAPGIEVDGCPVFH